MTHKGRKTDKTTSKPLQVIMKGDYIIKGTSPHGGAYQEKLNELTKMDLGIACHVDISHEKVCGIFNDGPCDCSFSIRAYTDWQ